MIIQFEISEYLYKCLKKRIELDVASELDLLVDKGTVIEQENPAAEKLSKMLNQALWELDHVGYQKEREQARADFMKRYGRSYL